MAELSGLFGFDGWIWYNVGMKKCAAIEISNGKKIEIIAADSVFCRIQI